MTDSFEKKIVELLALASSGDEEAKGELVEQLYRELHSQAYRVMGRDAGSHTLQPTALVNEAWMRLLGQGEANFVDKRHFLSAASKAMRCVIIDHVRKRDSVKRTIPGVRVPLEGVLDSFDQSGVDLLALGEALDALKREYPDLLPVVDLRFFAGLSMNEVAETRGVALRTCERDWYFVRSWLRKRLEPSGGAR
ncbi:MAG: ECF-type sigma factor [Planctomycetota bacterium]|nr:ECF-type sigma factor [Planctomycetota bacterium]